MNKDFKVEIIAFVIFVSIAIGILALSFFTAKWIAESDMPAWLKFWLLQA